MSIITIDARRQLLRSRYSVPDPCTLNPASQRTDPGMNAYQGNSGYTVAMAGGAGLLAGYVAWAWSENLVITTVDDINPASP